MRTSLFFCCLVLHQITICRCIKIFTIVIQYLLNFRTFRINSRKFKSFYFHSSLEIPLPIIPVPISLHICQSAKSFSFQCFGYHFCHLPFIIIHVDHAWQKKKAMLFTRPSILIFLNGQSSYRYCCLSANKCCCSFNRAIDFNCCLSSRESWSIMQFCRYASHHACVFRSR